MPVSGSLTPLRSLTSAQNKSGLAAWLGWLFDGLDMHIYTLVAVPVVAILLKEAAVNIGILLACVAGWLLADYSPRWIFLVGVLPALFTLWIRKEVPEPENWVAARGKTKPPGIAELFGPAVRSVTWRTLVICAVSLTAHWTFMFWQQSHIRSLPEVRVLDASGQNHAVVVALVWIMVGSLIGNYLAGWLAQRHGYRKAITWMLAAYGAAMLLAFSQPLDHGATLAWFCVIGICQGVFGLFTMCLPPLFPTLLRTTGAGFCYNIGRLFSAAGVVFFGFFVKVGDARVALFYAGLLFIPAALVALMLPERENDD